MGLHRVTTRYAAAWAVWLSLAVLTAAGADLRVVEAARDQDREAVRTLLQAGVDVNAAQADGATALAWAAHWDDAEMADLLLAAGADPNAANDYGVTPLALACGNRSAAIAEKLLAAGADPNAARWTGETPLMTAAAQGSVAVVKVLLAHGAKVDAREPRRGQTALMWAIAEGHPEVARVLIESGADVRARTHQFQMEGFSPMVVAAYGADFQATSKGGHTPLLFAARAGDLETARLLLEKGADVNESSPEQGSALVIAAAEGYEDLALFLLEQGADPNAADASGITALHYAMRDGLKLLHKIDIYKVQRVSQAGAGARCVALDDTAPLAVAEQAPVDRRARDADEILPERNLHRLARALLAKGANPNAQMLVPPPRLRLHRKPTINLTGATPFLLAASADDLSAMGYLVEAGAKPLLGTVIDRNEFFKEGFGDDNQIQGNGTPLMVAVGMGRENDFSPAEEQRALEAAKALVALGADGNQATETGWTPLHATAFLGADTLIEFLVANGASLNVRNGCGQTPLTLAEGSDARGLLQRVTPHRKTAQLLRRLGAVDSPAGAPVGRCVEGRFGLEYAVQAVEENKESSSPQP